MNWLGHPFKAIVDFALPARCPACGVVQADQGSFCLDCWSKLDFITPPWCAACGIPFEIEGEDMLCGQCLRKTSRHDGLRSALAYGDVVADTVLKLKYSGRIGLARMMAGHLERLLPEDRAGLIVTPVPLHWTRLFSRTYNQSGLIGAALAKRANLEYVPDLLIRTRRTPPLRGLNPNQRKRTVAGAFRVNPRCADRIRGARLLLIDDVYTSGATCNSCVSALKRAGAGSVHILTWTRVLRDR